MTTAKRGWKQSVKLPTWGRITVLGITNGDCSWGGSLRPVYILPKKERKNKLGLGLAIAGLASAMWTNCGVLRVALWITRHHCSRNESGGFEGLVFWSLGSVADQQKGRFVLELPLEREHPGPCVGPCVSFLQSLAESRVSGWPGNSDPPPPPAQVAHLAQVSPKVLTVLHVNCSVHSSEPSPKNLRRSQMDRFNPNNHNNSVLWAKAHGTRRRH